MKHDPGRKITAEEEENDQRILFTEIFGICLWGNAYDLSFFTCLVYKDIQKLQGAEARKSTEASILANDLPAVFENLWQAQKQHKGERRIDVILDKAGFELFADLVLAGYLLESGLATQVVLHPKNIPWFVSDAIPTDFSRLLSILARPQEFFQSNTAEGETQWPFTKAELDQLSLLFEQWSMLHSNGQLIVRPNAFWTTSYSYWDLPVQAPTLFEDLKGSELVIFKGDLHYRKLTADVRFPAVQSNLPLANSTVGKMAHHDSFFCCDWSFRKWIRYTDFSASNVQVRHSSGSSGRGGRAITTQ